MLFEHSPRQIRRPGTAPRRRLVWLLYVTCALTLVPILFLHPHAEFTFAELPGFHAALAFVTGCVLVGIAQLLRHLLIRPENYYEENGE